LPEDLVFGFFGAILRGADAFSFAGSAVETLT